MSDLQEEKVKKILKLHGVKVKDVIQKMFPQGKGSYYNELQKKPLTPEFLNGIKSNFGVDLVKELAEYETNWGIQKPEILKAENDALKAELDRVKNELYQMSKQLIEVLSKKQGGP